jgi:hypothetical protein
MTFHCLLRIVHFPACSVHSPGDSVRGTVRESPAVEHRQSSVAVVPGKEFRSGMKQHRPASIFPIAGLIESLRVEGIDHPFSVCAAPRCRYRKNPPLIRCVIPGSGAPVASSSNDGDSQGRAGKISSSFHSGTNLWCRADPTAVSRRSLVYGIGDRPSLGPAG